MQGKKQKEHVSKHHEKNIFRKYQFSLNAHKIGEFYLHAEIPSSHHKSWTAHNACTETRMGGCQFHKQKPQKMKKKVHETSETDKLN